MGPLAPDLLARPASKVAAVTLSFWIMKVLATTLGETAGETRPFGATFGDLLTKPLASGGLNMPREYASLTTLAVLLAVLYFFHTAA